MGTPTIVFGTAVEFQLRRKALKRHFSITTARELFDNLGTITKWCHDEWFRIVDEFDARIGTMHELKPANSGKRFSRLSNRGLVPPYPAFATGGGWSRI